MKSSRPLIDAAVAIHGSETALAKACDVRQGTIWKARSVGRVSAELAVKIDRATKGAIPRWRLRPDLWDAPAAPAASKDRDLPAVTSPEGV